MTQPDRLEAVAEALFRHRWPKRNQSWEFIKLTEPDIAKIYLDNARVALNAAAIAMRKQQEGAGK
jgi:hypothetical protein